MFMLLALGGSVGSTGPPLEMFVCQNYAVHARTTITFDGVTSSIPIDSII